MYIYTHIHTYIYISIHLYEHPYLKPLSLCVDISRKILQLSRHQDKFLHIYKYTYIYIHVHTLSRAAFLSAIAEEYFAEVSSASALANAGTSPRASARAAPSAAPPPTPPTLNDSFCLHDVLCAFQCTLWGTVIYKLDGSGTIIFECGVYVCTHIHV